jgi:hypothetical protein
MNCGEFPDASRHGLQRIPWNVTTAEKDRFSIRRPPALVVDFTRRVGHIVKRLRRNVRSDVRKRYQYREQSTMINGLFGQTDSTFLPERGEILIL